ncbi:hypothetical protein FB471_2325 [Amycolatopsis cihanbeyliensis]|uniref:Uncharacterized protein n=1 Tax=Amycolatopsis cihanbeyliensis TaxID=1128664 RepID=A0A542DHN3_AMYCI|nr:hypothetical protein FB471_2325 [Amycolatopsis cihanbeyliensis]
MNRTASTLTAGQQAWVSAFAAAGTLLLIIALGALG